MQQQKRQQQIAAAANSSSSNYSLSSLQITDLRIEALLKSQSNPGKIRGHHF